MTEGRTPAAKVRFRAGEPININAQVYLCLAGDTSLLTTVRELADPRHPEPVGTIETGPVFKVNARGEELLKVVGA